MSFSTLVSAAVLADHLDHPGWRVFDCRHLLTDPEAGSRAYAAAHLPGGLLRASWSEWWSDQARPMACSTTAASTE